MCTQLKESTSELAICIEVSDKFNLENAIRISVVTLVTQRISKRKLFRKLTVCPTRNVSTRFATRFLPFERLWRYFVTLVTKGFLYLSMCLHA